MKPQYLGDSYDIVKQSILRWLSVLGAWKAYPMFTESIAEEDANIFSEFLGIPLLSTEVLRQETNRDSYFASAHACRSHLFVDPDTGLRLEKITGKKQPAYLFGIEAITLVTKRPKSLTLVFDQSLPRGGERDSITAKINYLHSNGIFSFAYVSHACLILMSLQEELIDEAFKVIQKESRLPEARFIRYPKYI